MATTAIGGLTIGTGNGGLTKGERHDVAVLRFAGPVPTAAVFTRNAFAAAPVVVARRNVQGGHSAAWVINAGNANCGTGAPGMALAEWTCQSVGQRLGVDAAAVLPFSTGVIMERLPRARLARGVKAALAGLRPDNWEAAAKAIMTTDTAPKFAASTIDDASGTCRLAGIAKGSGMINPNMATMLAFIVTDAKVGAGWLRTTLRAAVAGSFNAITVDGDTSTNDAVAIAATGTAGKPTAAGLRELARALADLCHDLAGQIVRDGEGTTTTATVSCTGLASTTACRAVCDFVANSPLVKTMLHARDANLGRLLMAVGRAPVDPQRVEIRINDVPAFRAGARVPAFTEARASRLLAAGPPHIAIIAGDGPATATVRFCDLGPDYITINSAYRS